MQYFTVTTALVALTTLTGLVAGVPPATFGVGQPTFAAPTGTQSAFNPNPTAIENGTVAGFGAWSGTICCPVPGQPFVPQDAANVQKAAQMVNENHDVESLLVTSPGSCYTVATVENSSVILCNDRYNGFIDTDGVSTYAWNIALECEVGGVTCGQMFNDDGWNVVITKYTGLIAPYIF